MKKFIMKADIEFSAESIEDAVIKLAAHLEGLFRGDDSHLIELGRIQIEPKDKVSN